MTRAAAITGSVSIPEIYPQEPGSSAGRRTAPNGESSDELDPISLNRRGGSPSVSDRMTVLRKSSFTLPLARRSRRSPPESIEESKLPGQDEPFEGNDRSSRFIAVEPSEEPQRPPRNALLRPVGRRLASDPTPSRPAPFRPAHNQSSIDRGSHHRPLDPLLA